ncbi:hypothetical protein GQ457_17G018840 [Hibiscus cannabinus]
MVETRSQTALVAQEESVAAATTNVTANQPSLSELKQEVTHLQTNFTRLETSLDERFQTMQTVMMANLHRMLEIGLGKKIDTEAGLLGTPPNATTKVHTEPIPAPSVTTMPSSSTPVVLIVDEEVKGNSQINTAQSMNFSYKLFCPKFDGTDFRGWNSKLEQFFEAEMVTDSAKIRLVMLHLEGRTLQWHQFVTKSQGRSNPMQWNEYIGLMRERFAPAGFEDPFAELLALRQTDSVDQFYEEFIHLLNQVQVPDDYVLSMFKNHLRIEISQFVKLLNPTSLLSAFHLAKHVEAMFFPSQKKVSLPSQRPPPPPALTIPARTSSTIFKSGYSSGSYPGQASSKLSSPNNQSLTAAKIGGSGGPRNVGKSLSPAEIEERKRKGLCFWCAAKYTPGHKCAKSQLYQIAVEGIEEENEAEIFLDCEENVDGEGIENIKEEGPVLSLNAMWGATNVETMKILVTMGDQQFIALLDSGISHNFISWTIVKQLKLGVIRRNQLKVVVADGNWMKTMGECKAIDWMVQGTRFSADFLVLPLKNCDMVLGVQWLSQLGNIKWNFAELKMTFQYAGREVEWTGLQSGSLQLIESKECSKLLKGNKSPWTAAIWMLKAQLEIKSSGEKTPRELQTLLQQFSDVFDEPQGLPPDRGHDHTD